MGRDYYKAGRGAEKCTKMQEMVLVVPSLKPGYTKHLSSLILLTDLKQEFWLPLCGAAGCSMIGIPLFRLYAYHMLSSGHQVIIHWPLAQLITELLEEIISDKTLDLTILHSATFVKLVDKTAGHWQHKRQSRPSPPPLLDSGWSILSPDTFLVLTELVRGPSNDFQSFQVAKLNMVSVDWREVACVKECSALKQ